MYSRILAAGSFVVKSLLIIVNEDSLVCEDEHSVFLCSRQHFDDIFCCSLQKVTKLFRANIRISMMVQISGTAINLYNCQTATSDATDS